MRNSILVAWFGIAVIAAVPAGATTSTFDFTTGSGGSGSNLSSYTAACTTGATGCATGLTATAVAFYATGTSSGPTGKLTSGEVGEYVNAGLGICENQTGSNCSSPNHQISDGNNGSGSTDDYEFMLIEFTTAVNLSQIQLGNWGTNGTTTDPFGLTYYTSTSTSSLSSVEAALEATTVGADSAFTAGAATSCQSTGSINTSNANSDNNGSGSYNGDCAVNGNGVETLTGTGVTYLLIGASLSGNGSDYFKIQDLNVTNYSKTPEPATFGLIGLSLAGLGLIRRRRKLS